MLSFAILIWFTVKFIWPPLMRGDRGTPAEDRRRPRRRRQQPEEPCAGAGQGQRGAARTARVKANEIIEQAHQRANQIIDQAKNDAIAEANRQKALAEAEIAAAANRAKEDLRKQVSALAVTGAEKLLRREIDANAHKALLDELAAEI